MTIPGLGAVSLSGFDQPWWLLLALVPVALIGRYGAVQVRRSRRVRRFTATGEAIFTALQSIATVKAVTSGDDDRQPPARIVLLSDGKENKPGNPDNPRGCYTAARTAKDQGVSISTCLAILLNRRLPI